MTNIEEHPFTPYIRKSFRISNITQMKTLLKGMQKKYQNYKVGEISKNKYPLFFVTKKDIFSVESIYQGHLQSKFIEKFAVLKKDVLNEVESEMETFISQKKTEFDFVNFNVYFEDSCEDNLFMAPSTNTFKDDLLFDTYQFLSSPYLDSRVFLETSYDRHISRFLLKNGHTVRNANYVRDFINLRYSSLVSSLAVYEKRTLWAEVFVYFRSGFHDKIKQLINEFTEFFNTFNDSFGSYFLLYLEKGMKFTNIVTVLSTDDVFKKVLVGYMEGKVINEPTVISSCEDYLFSNLITDTSVNPKVFFDNRIQLLALILSKDYKEATRLLFKSEFGIIPKYFLLRKMCTDKKFINTPDDQTLDFTHVENSRFFCIFVFKIIERMSLYSNKIKMVENLQEEPAFGPFIAEFVVKHNLVEIIKEPFISTTFREKIVKVVLKNNKKKLISIIDYLEQSLISEILEEVIEQAILTDTVLPKSVNLSNPQNSKVNVLISFYKFNFESTISALKATPISDPDTNLIPYKSIVEHVFKKAVTVAKAKNERNICKKLFELNGLLNLNDECSCLLTSEFLSII